MNFLNILFLICLLLILHTYIIYPFSIYIIQLFFKKNYLSDLNHFPIVSIIISVYNEEKVISKTITNFCEQDYPRDKFEILIGSDGSTDNTDSIVAMLSNQYSNIKLISFEKRRGKKFVVNDLVNQSSGEILVFSDANTIYNKNAIKHLVKYYADQRVGGVSGRLELVTDYDTTERSNKEGTYWKYESWLKDCEGKLGILIGANGGIYSIKKEFFIPMPSDVSVVDDLFTSLKVLEQGKDFLYCKAALANETVAPSVKWEFDRKVRIIPRCFDTLKEVKKILFSKSMLLSYAIWSHKVIRWLTPLFFISLLFTNILISIFQSGLIFNIILFFQLAVIISGVLGYTLAGRKYDIKLFQLSYYFLSTNFALLTGIYFYVTKKYKATWQPTPR